ncbi:unnamed protein product [Soboliphyme baturini]|uniref:Serine/arginine repetitive matrix protein 1 n=1 Tax=Soboliphyme baturini TaxID=241478 RepID=A0A183IGW3_9BILA|nr:unnamed protein product [Soboliphyme baturini]
MGDAGFFRGTSAEQDNRFTDKQKKLLKTLKFPENVSQKVDLKKVNLDLLKPWITLRVNEILGVEDDVVIEFIFSQLEEENPDPRLMQINLTGFLNAKKAREFMGELWQLLIDAQDAPDGIPPKLVELKKQEMKKQMDEESKLKIKEEIEKVIEERTGRQDRSKVRSPERSLERVKEHSPRRADWERIRERDYNRERFRERYRDRYEEDYPKHKGREHER